jgi:hypothetical protein
VTQEKGGKEQFRKEMKKERVEVRRRKMGSLK